MVTWMTCAENRILEAACKQGFLVCRPDQRTLIDQFASTCASRNRPVLRVDRHAQQCQVVLQWPRELPPLVAEMQEDLRRLLAPEGSTGLLPIVFRFGLYSTFLEQACAESLARRLALWIQEQDPFR